MFTLQPYTVTTAPAAAAGRGDLDQQLFAFATAPEQRWGAEAIDTGSGVVVCSDVYEDPYHALWDAATALLDEITPAMVEFD